MRKSSRKCSLPCQWSWSVEPTYNISLHISPVFVCIYPLSVSQSKFSTRVSLRVVYPQVTTSNVSRDGTVLQKAKVEKGKENFVRILLEFRFDHSLSLNLIQRPFSVRVDPTAKLDNELDTPMEMAVLRDRKEILKILTEYKEIPDDVKLIQLSKLLEEAKRAIRNYREAPIEHLKKAFQDILHTLPVEMVKQLRIECKL
jgi:hypothetical protein